MEVSDHEEIDLASLLGDSLSLQVNTTPMARPLNKQPFKDTCFEILKQDPFEILGEESFGSPKEVAREVVGSPIQEFFRDTNVFITGGTGFIGKILTEKLVRSIPHIGKIYLLIREKRGKLVKERFEQLMADKVFGRMKAEVPDWSSKIQPVAGDIAESGLGLSTADAQLLRDRVHVVFHGAADVRFVEPLRTALQSNVLGSRRVLHLAKTFKELKSYVHVSTAFSQCVLRKIPENVPKLPVSYKEIIEIVERKTDEELENEINILQGWPNTYTFTKAVCEEMLAEESIGMPICIFRPSIVFNTYKEPVRGWTDNVYGPLGMMIAAAMGVLHIVRFDFAVPQDVVPVDYVVNCMISCAHKNQTYQQHDEILVYNFTSTPGTYSCQKMWFNWGVQTINYWPLVQATWFCSLMVSESYICHELGHFFLHKIPGLVLDKLSTLRGQKPRLTKLYSHIYALQKPLRYFSLRTWEFNNDNVKQLWTSMDENDKCEFAFDWTDYDTRDHVTYAHLGTRYYYLKESMESIPSARRKQKWLLLAHRSLKLVSALLALKVLTLVAHVLPF